MDDFDKRLLDEFQHDFPLCPHPFASIAERLGMGEEDVLSAYRHLSEAGYVSRIGAVIKPHAVGASTLAAMCVPSDRLEKVAAFVSNLDEVNHNYEREHAFNLWFVATAQDEDSLTQVLNNIRDKTRLAVMNLPMLEDYHLDLGFPIRWS